MQIYTWCKTHQIDPTASLFCLTTWQKIRTLRDSGKHKDQGSLLPNTGAQCHQTFTVPRKPLPRKSTQQVSDQDPTKALPEYRLPLVLPFSLLIPIGLSSTAGPPKTRSTGRPQPSELASSPSASSSASTAPKHTSLILTRRMRLVRLGRRLLFGLWRVLLSRCLRRGCMMCWGWGGGTVYWGL